jgi:hypothetical protein
VTIDVRVHGRGGQGVVIAVVAPCTRRAINGGRFYNTRLHDTPGVAPVRRFAP